MTWRLRDLIGERRGWPLRLLSALTLLLTTALPAVAQYRLDSGDVLEVSVFGVQDFKVKTSVNVDGEVSLPLLGDVRAAGATVPELRAKLKEALVSNNIIRGPDVTVDLVELRPFFINGDVAKPGAHPYRKDLTVRRAVAIAGGYDLLRLKVDNPLLAAAELRSQYEGLWAEFIRRQARVTSLKAEIDEKPTIDLANLDSAPIATRIITAIAHLEYDHFSARQAEHQKEKEYLRRSLQHASDAVSALFEGQKQELLGVQVAADSLARTSALNARGLAPANRLTEELRTSALQKSRQLETGARLADAQQRLEDSRRRLDRADDERRLKTLRELQDAVVELEKVRTQLQGVGEKLLYTGAIKSLLGRGEHYKPEIGIYRKVAGREVSLVGTDDTELLPGDVVDIVFSQKQLLLTGAP